jgi:hypothetical protein
LLKERMELRYISPHIRGAGEQPHPERIAERKVEFADSLARGRIRRGGAGRGKGEEGEDEGEGCEETDPSPA